MFRKHIRFWEMASPAIQKIPYNRRGIMISRPDEWVSGFIDERKSSQAERLDLSL